MPPHSHPNGYFSFLMEGTVKETVNGHTYQRSPGMVVYHPAYIPHINLLTASRATLFHIEWMGIKGDLLNNPDDFKDLQIVFDEKIIKLIRSIYNDTYSEDDNSTLLQKGFDLFLNAEKSNCKKRFLKRPDWLEHLLNYININYYHTLNLETLAEEVGKHPVHVSRTFKKYMLCPISSYIAKLRVEEASAKLKNDDLSLAPLAYDLGFSDQSHFSRVFKEYVGVSPSVYRSIHTQ